MKGKILLVGFLAVFMLGSNPLMADPEQTTPAKAESTITKVIDWAVDLLHKFKNWVDGDTASGGLPKKAKEFGKDFSEKIGDPSTDDEGELPSTSPKAPFGDPKPKTSHSEKTEEKKSKDPSKKALEKVGHDPILEDSNPTNNHELPKEES
jgi:hypothetical protein